MEFKKFFVFLALIILFIPGTQGREINYDYKVYQNDTPDVPVQPPDEELNQEECLVPCDEIVGGGPGKDGIPAIDNPVFQTVAEADTVLDDDDTVIGVSFNGVTRAYPYEILNWHEIANDAFDGINLSITLCPLTGTGIVFRVSALEDSTLGVSGKLYENNLVFYDRVSDTYFSQMKGIGIKGEKMGVVVDREVAIETTWGAWKVMYPDSEVLTRDTGHSRNYDSYPYGNYESDESIYFKSAYLANTEIKDYYQMKTLTVVMDLLGVTNLISFNELAADPAMEIDDKAVIFFDFNHRTAVAFTPTLNDGTQLTFSPVDASDETFGMQGFVDDQTGSLWNILGTAVSGELTGTSLRQIVTYNAFWFAAVAFFPDAIVHLVNSEPYTPTEVPSIPSSTENTPLFLSPLLIFVPLIRWFRKRR